MADPRGSDDVPGRLELEAMMRSEGELHQPRLEDLLRRPAWYSDASCRGMGHATFFPGTGQPLEPALQICRACPVAVQCRAEVADDVRATGIWGGESMHARTQARLRRGAAWGRDPDAMRGA